MPHKPYPWEREPEPPHEKRERLEFLIEYLDWLLKQPALPGKFAWNESELRRWRREAEFSLRELNGQVARIASENELAARQAREEQ